MRGVFPAGMFPGRLAAPRFVQYGQDFAGAPDDGAGRSSSLCHFIVSNRNMMIYHDRLGTNIGNVWGKRDVSAQGNGCMSSSLAPRATRRFSKTTTRSYLGACLRNRFWSAMRTSSGGALLRCAKRHFLRCHLYTKCTVLRRRARGKHRES